MSLDEGQLPQTVALDALLAPAAAVVSAAVGGGGEEGSSSPPHSCAMASPVAVSSQAEQAPPAPPAADAEERAVAVTGDVADAADVTDATGTDGTADERETAAADDAVLSESEHGANEEAEAEAEAEAAGAEAHALVVKRSESALEEEALWLAAQVSDAPSSDPAHATLVAPPVSWR